VYYHASHSSSRCCCWQQQQQQQQQHNKTAAQSPPVLLGWTSVLRPRARQMPATPATQHTQQHHSLRERPISADQSNLLCCLLQMQSHHHLAVFALPAHRSVQSSSQPVGLCTCTAVTAAHGCIPRAAHILARKLRACLEQEQLLCTCGSQLTGPYAV
jgi:hypothetical protein